MNNTNNIGINAQQIHNETANPFNSTIGAIPINNPYIQRGLGDNPYARQNLSSPPQSQATEASANTGGLFSFLGSGTTQKDMLKGALIGAVATFILTNEDAQKAIFKNFAKLSSLFEVGIEELKERYEDAKAEVSLTDD